MKKTRHRFASILFAVLISTLIAGIFMPTKAAEPVEQQGLVDQARITFQSFISDPNMAYLKDHLREARGLLIVPSMLKAGFFVGGSGGTGALIVKERENRAMEPTGLLHFRLRKFWTSIRRGGRGSDHDGEDPKGSGQVAHIFFQARGRYFHRRRAGGRRCQIECRGRHIFLFAIQRRFCRNRLGWRCHLDKGQMEQCLLWKSSDACGHSCQAFCQQPWVKRTA